jgi:ubiquinone biosynthesis protein COQ9
VGLDDSGGAGDGQALRLRLLTTALAHVPTKGFSAEAIAAAAVEHGVSVATVGLFEHGPVELVEHFITACNMNMAAQIERAELLRLPVLERIRRVTKLRLQMLVPHLNTWPQALVLMAQPQNMGVSLKNAASTVAMMWELIDEEIVDTKPADSTLDWCEAGSPTDRSAVDESTPGHFVAKRVILSAVYASTELFLLSDPSPGQYRTWEFLDRRVDDALLATGSLGAAERWAGRAAAGLGAMDPKLVSEIVFSNFDEDATNADPPPLPPPPPPPPPATVTTATATTATTATAATTEKMGNGKMEIGKVMRSA